MPPQMQAAATVSPQQGSLLQSTHNTLSKLDAVLNTMAQKLGYRDAGQLVSAMLRYPKGSGADLSPEKLLVRSVSEGIKRGAEEAAEREEQQAKKNEELQKELDSKMAEYRNNSEDYEREPEIKGDRVGVSPRRMVSRDAREGGTVERIVRSTADGTDNKATGDVKSSPHGDRTPDVDPLKIKDHADMHGGITPLESHALKVATRSDGFQVLSPTEQQAADEVLEERSTGKKKIRLV